MYKPFSKNTDHIERESMISINDIQGMPPKACIQSNRGRKLRSLISKKQDAQLRQRLTCFFHTIYSTLHKEPRLATPSLLCDVETTLANTPTNQVQIWASPKLNQTKLRQKTKYLTSRNNG